MLVGMRRLLGMKNLRCTRTCSHDERTLRILLSPFVTVFCFIFVPTSFSVPLCSQLVPMISLPLKIVTLVVTGNFFGEEDVIF